MSSPLPSRLASPTFPLPDEALDVLIIGAGINGIGMLWELRDRGFENVRLIDRAAGVGGTWYWNRYPGARFDSESYTYGFFKDPRLLREWRWREHFAAQPETELYLNHVTDRAGLRPYMDFSIDVTAAVWDEQHRIWTVTSRDGRTYRTRILITALGILSHPQYPSVIGIESFGGVNVHTARWPKEGVDLAGKRVAVVGTGASGVQVIPEIANVAAEVVVFQRTPNWVSPLNNSEITDAEWDDITSRFDELREVCSSRYGFVHRFDSRSAHDLTADQRREFYELVWRRRGFAKYLGNFVEVARDLAINEEFRAFVADKVRATVRDPATAEKLIPTDHPYGGKRTPFGTGYYEAYNEPHVSLVSLKDEPLVRVTDSGIETTKGHYDVDVLVWATGFDTLTGAWDQIDFRGTDAQTLRERWADGPWTYLGMQTPGFPNLLIVSGPNAVGGNVPRAAEIHIEFAGELIGAMSDEGQTRVEARRDAADRWTAHARDTGVSVLTSKHTDYNWGANTDGKTVAFRAYSGGLDGLRAGVDDSRKDGFAGFDRER